MWEKDIFFGRCNGLSNKEKLKLKLRITIDPICIFFVLFFFPLGKSRYGIFLHKYWKDLPC